jgi:purine-binding chemotaxis protein CheW
MSDAATPSKAAGKYLAFRLGAVEYGIPILSVHEIIGILPITPVPRARDCVRGVVNLRGKIVPVVDLRSKFRMPAAPGAELCIVVVRSAGTDLGVLVDAVSEVVSVAASEIATTPSLGDQLDDAYVTGISTANGKVRFLLDIDAVLAAEQPPEPASASLAHGSPAQ